MKRTSQGDDFLFLRQEDVLWPPRDLAMPVVIIGAGAVGSVTAYLLAKLGCLDVTIYDNDIVEIHNTSYSFYPKKFAPKAKDGVSISWAKVEALRIALRYSMSGRIKRWQFIDERFFDQSLPQNCLVIVAVDDMDVRIDFWKRKFRGNQNIALLIESRIVWETYFLYTMRPWLAEDIHFYEDHLYPQSEGVEGTCGERSIVYSVDGLAGEIVFHVKRFVKNEPCPREVIRHYASDTFIVNY